MQLLTVDNNDKILHPKGCKRLYECFIRAIFALNQPQLETLNHTLKLLTVLGSALVLHMDEGNSGHVHL